MNKEDALKYEIANSPIAEYISNEWLQKKLLAPYYVWKVNKKYDKYIMYKCMEEVYNYNK